MIYIIISILFANVAPLKWLLHRWTRRRKRGIELCRCELCRCIFICKVLQRYSTEHHRKPISLILRTARWTLAVIRQGYYEFGSCSVRPLQLHSPLSQFLSFLPDKWGYFHSLDCWHCMLLLNWVQFWKHEQSQALVWFFGTVNISLVLIIGSSAKRRVIVARWR